MSTNALTVVTAIATATALTIAYKMGKRDGRKEMITAVQRSIIGDLLNEKSHAN